MTNEEMAEKIAEAANACCHRSDGFEKSIYDLALQYLEDAYTKGADQNFVDPNFYSS